MIDIKAPLRKAYYQLYNGNLTFNGNPVPVSDSVEKLSDSVDLYVLLMQQTGVSQNTMSSFHSEETMTIDIVYRGTRVNKNTIDYIASQIFSLLLPAPNGNALPQQPNVSIINVRMTDDRYIIFQTTGGKNITRRLITFTQFVSPYSSGGAVPPIPAGSSIYTDFLHLTSVNFTNATDCPISQFANQNIEVFYNEDQRWLLKANGEWSDLLGGGFKILIPGFDSSHAVYNFYVHLVP